ncbi:MAG: lysophospholipid acyltransferase family protein [Deltaproteobacteria bacterium]|nr:lysophospholipid acyltransferase family protein [Deltaproteobacteria bacterium]
MALCIKPNLVDFSPSLPHSQPWLKMLRRPLNSALGFKKCSRLYHQIDVTHDVGTFAERALAQLEVNWNVTEVVQGQVPQTGAMIVVANHPFGGVEGLVLIAHLMRTRQDIKILANPFLSRIPELQNVLLPIDPYETKYSQRNNIIALRQGYQWLETGGSLVVFPAGGVAHFHLRCRGVIDPVWKLGVGRLIARSQADVVPVYFPGNNGLGFQAAGFVHPRLRTLLLARELLNKKGAQVEAIVGSRISAKHLQKIGPVEEQMECLRLKTYLLGDDLASFKKANNHLTTGPSNDSNDCIPVVPPIRAETLTQAVDTLAKESLLLSNGSSHVFCIRAEQSPLIIHEIGRLRELTFRQSGEGTGRSIDLDRFDEHYMHLFVWNTKKKEIVGAYRLGLTDEILGQKGFDGLYTNTLFHYQKELFESVGPALELGRSFVRAEYQKSFSALLLLWQGIGRFLVRNPKYRVLFGPVSISQSYTSFSRQLITSTLHSQVMATDLAKFVEPRQPVAIRSPKIKGCSDKLIWSCKQSLEMVDMLLAGIENDGKGLPVLLRHYLNLGGKVLAFNLDPEFSNVVDSLVLVNLDAADRKTLRRYLGRDGMELYASYAMKKPVPNAA